MVSQKQAMFDNLENMCDHWSYYDQSSAKTHELEKKLLEHEMEMVSHSALDERVAQTTVTALELEKAKQRNVLRLRDSQCF